MWFVCKDGTVRPVVRAEALTSDGRWQPLEFLVDTGADNTVFSADVREALQFPPQQTGVLLAEIGGASDAEVLDVEFRLRQAGVIPVTFRGQFLAAVEPSALDMSVLGRDILNLFAVIVDRPQEIVCLLSQRHHCVIVEE